MNTLTKITVFIALLLTILFTTSSCTFEGITGIAGNKNVVSEDRMISSDFNAIKVQQGIHLYLTQGNSIDINVEADENIIDLLITEVKDNELKIYFKKNVYKAKARNVYLTANKISEIRTSSGALAKSKNTIETASLILDSSSGSSIKMEVKADKINLEASSGSNINVSGDSNSIIAKASSGSTINTYKLKTADATTKVSSGASIRVYVSQNLMAKASSGGSVNYEGNPSKIDKKTSSGGSVTQN